MTIQLPAPMHMDKPDSKHPKHDARHSHLVRIPNKINGVTVEFAPDVHNAVDPSLVRALHYCIYTSVGHAHSRDLHTIYIGSIADHHDKPKEKNSRHNQNKAVDISRINGCRVKSHYNKDHHITLIVNGIQAMFERAPSRRENFGPHLNLKLGAPHNPGRMHDDHVHLSTN